MKEIKKIKVLPIAPKEVYALKNNFLAMEEDKDVKGFNQYRLDVENYKSINRIMKNVVFFFWFTVISLAVTIIALFINN